MRRTRVILLALAATFAGAGAANAYDWRSRASYNAEMRRQHDRIMDGRRSGKLTPAEYRTVHNHLHRIGAMGYNSRTKVMLSRHSKKVSYHKTN